MNTLIVSGKTIEEAVQKGLTELQTTKDLVTVQVLEQPSRGLFGLFGVRPAKVELTRITTKPAAVPVEAPSQSSDASSNHVAVSVDEQGEETAHSSNAKALSKEQGVEEAKKFVYDVAESMGLHIEITVDKRKDHLLFDIAGSDLGLIIGRRGQTLDSLQYLTNLVANRYSDQHLRITLDAEDFRARRKETLEALAERLANKAIRTRKEVMLEPMPPQERKIIHAKLQDHAKIKTYSKGEEPNRRIVISLKS
ncbi:RNA-binding cell elongation regulator Jag/EloR [Paenibacillus aquistagni]|uniref:RNA-binding cell elongation regulator Jag/EloR n=1 Tax=Paenibacillus aquistagni TaxID=1852522 RepID=UPI00145A2FCA|nr:RNA-binding cell elongation regulator Jag/EloR [Paenibacillus aquistagni]NMM52238.1 protein jag [Paenibacillus aquistagni]